MGAGGPTRRDGIASFICSPTGRDGIASFIYRNARYFASLSRGDLQRERVAFTRGRAHKFFFLRNGKASMRHQSDISGTDHS
jgi:hypothetical protein